MEIKCARLVSFFLTIVEAPPFFLRIKAEISLSISSDERKKRENSAIFQWKLVKQW